MISLNTNLSSILVQTNLKGATTGLTRAIERMTTGFRINHAKDDAAGYSISKTMTSKLSSYQIAQDNAEIGLSYLSTAEGNLDLVSDHLQRIRDLTEQASNGTYSAESREAIQAEIDERIAEINRVLDTAEYNGQKIFKDPSAVTFAQPRMYTKARTASAPQSSTEPEPVAQTFGLARAATSENYFISDPISYSAEEVAAMTTMTELADGVTSATNKYSISTKDELVALATYVNAGNDTTGMTFVLGDDIDLSSISNWTPIGDYSTNSSYIFKGTFDGNGYVIKNLNIDRSSSKYQGLFGLMWSGEIKNVGVVGGTVKGSSCVGAVLGYGYGKIVNCFSTASIIGNSNDSEYVGGLIGGRYVATGSKLEISNCYATGDVQGYMFVGGLVGSATSIVNSYATGAVTASFSQVGGLAASVDTSIVNSYATGSVKGKNYVGGLVCNANNCEVRNCYSTGDCSVSMYYIGGLVGADVPAKATLINCYSTGRISGGSSSAIGRVNSSDWDGTYFTYGEASIPGNVKTDPTPDPDPDPDPTPDPDPDPPAGGGGGITIPEGSIGFFVGINGNAGSMIAVDTRFDFALDVDVTTAESASNALAEIDEWLKEVSSMQTHIGASSNRLESVLDSIQANIESLTTSLSTMRDADIAKESTNYLQQQILQNACATLLSTANQTPSIALALINGASL